MLGNTVIFILSFVLVLGLVVFFHELGHYGMAKLFGTKIEKFSVGFGKPVARWVSKRTGEEWVIGRLPLGGYVKFAGDMNAASVPDAAQLEALRDEMGEGEAARLFQFKPVWQRALVVLAGPMANFVLSALIFAVTALVFGIAVLRPTVGEVLEDSRAQAAGIEVGDTIVEIDGRRMEDARDALTYVSLRAETPMLVTVERDGRTLDIPITPARIEEDDMIGGASKRGLLGVRWDQEQGVEITKSGPVQALGYGTSAVVTGIAATGTYIKRIFTGQEDGKALGGIGRIGAMSGKAGVDAWSSGETAGGKFKALFWQLISMMAALSLGLGIANLMPIPMLDGGHLVFYGYEAVAGRPLSQRAQDMGFRMGLALLLGLFVILTINDVGYIRSLFS